MAAQLVAMALRCRLTEMDVMVMTADIAIHVLGIIALITIGVVFLAVPDRVQNWTLIQYRWMRGVPLLRTLYGYLESRFLYTLVTRVAGLAFLSMGLTLLLLSLGTLPVFRR